MHCDYTSYLYEMCLRITVLVSVRLGRAGCWHEAEWECVHDKHPYLLRNVWNVLQGPLRPFSTHQDQHPHNRSLATGHLHMQMEELLPSPSSVPQMCESPVLYTLDDHFPYVVTCHVEVVPGHLLPGSQPEWKAKSLHLFQLLLNLTLGTVAQPIKQLSTKLEHRYGYQFKIHLLMLHTRSSRCPKHLSPCLHKVPMMKLQP